MFKNRKSLIFMGIFAVLMIITGVIVIREYQRISKLVPEDLEYKTIVITKVYHDDDDSYYEVTTKDKITYTIETSLVSYSDLKNIKETDDVVIGKEHDSYTIATLKVNGNEWVTFEEFKANNRRTTLAFVIAIPSIFAGCIVVTIISAIKTKKNQKKEQEEVQNEEINMTIYNEVLDSYSEENGEKHFLYKDKFIDKFTRSVAEALMSLLNENEVTVFNLEYEYNDNEDIKQLMLLYKRNNNLYYEEILADSDPDDCKELTEWTYPPYKKLTEEEQECYKRALEYYKMTNNK